MASQRRMSSRKSIAYLPSPDIDLASENKENFDSATTIITAPPGLDSKQSKARSKSLGPGGLDALKKDAGNRRKIVPAPRSILKPTVPLSPLREIPARKSTAQAASAFRSPAKSNQSPASSPFRNTPLSSPVRRLPPSASKPSPDTPASQVESPLDEARLERQRQREEIQKQREARRKSLANRRVSFAPEATLHTFDSLEELQDSTTSSASTEFTRRASSTTQNPFIPSELDNGALPNEDLARGTQESPTGQPSPQKERRRRSSAVPPVNLYSPDDVTLSSPSNEANDQSEIACSPSEILSSVQSSPARSDGGDEGTAMEIAGDEVTAAFRPWVQKQHSGLQSTTFPPPREEDPMKTFSPAFKIAQANTAAGAASPAQTVYDNTDMSMDITHAIGGIIRDQGAAPSPKRRKSTISRRRSSGANSSSETSTMDFTTALGGIQTLSNRDVDDSHLDANEELSMEFTNIFGGGIRRDHPSSTQVDSGRTEIHSTLLEDEDVIMGGVDDVEMTDSTGQDSGHPNEPDEEGNASQMDMTRAIGGILSSTRSEVAVSPVRGEANELLRAATIASATAIPNLASSLGARSTGKADATPFLQTPPRALRTPEKQITPQPAARPSTPSKTPPPNIAMRHPSPKRLFQAEIRQAKASPLARSPGDGLFDHDQIKGTHTPRIRLMPKSQTRHRTSGVGFDRHGLGSPKVAAILDRRASIGDQADIFALKDIESRGVRFQDPRLLAAEVSRDQMEEERRESGQAVLEQEVDGEGDERDATMTLKEAIVGMSPKKNKLNGRKSLAVGAAKGLLGKRPLELDDEDDEGTPTGLRGRESSPVKRIKLQAPPSIYETTGRNLNFGASVGSSIGNARPMTPLNGSPGRVSASTPSHVGHFKDVSSNTVKGFSQKLKEGAMPVNQLESQDNEKIGLQDFLNLTSIRFMELNTTKRRHTIAPKPHRELEVQRDPNQEFADAVVAGACTLPMLELYQHSCRELKKYISEGRKIVREIEASTAEENPQLFREYMQASPADRAVMDNQFKNMKTHARHLSKAMWYEWRMKLLEGLQEGLVKEEQGFESDNALLAEAERALSNVLPGLLEEHERLLLESTELQRHADEIAECDQDELLQARQQLLDAEQQVRDKKERIAQMKAEFEELEKSVEMGHEAVTECRQEIREAQRVREEYRGWSESEVNKIKAKVDALEAERGWTITSAAGSQLTMVYRHQLELFFDLAAFSSPSTKALKNGPIRLTYIADTTGRKALPLTTNKRFFLQMMQAHLPSLAQNQTSAKDLLTFVSSTWTEALSLADEIRRVDQEGITHCDILSDERLAVKTMLLVPTAESKVNVTFEIGAAVGGMAVVVKLKTKAESVYGRQYREDKLRDFLKARIGESLAEGSGSWASAVRELKKKLIAQGKN